MSDIKYFCVSDIHSFYNPLMASLNNKGFDINNKNHKLIVCGDAFDRGNDTIQVFDFLKKLHEEGRLIYIRGNHEDLLFDCIEELMKRKTPSSHHFHNQTVKTICMLCGENEWVAYVPTIEFTRKVEEHVTPLLNFINEVCVNYFMLGNKIFVHSWLPTYNNLNGDQVWEDWFKYEKGSNHMWEQARWGNPFLMWKNKLYPNNKCVVFGHWHCSYGHSHIDMKTKEFPQINQINKMEEAFKPWIKENAIGLDACVAYSGKINCLVFDENGNLLE